MGTKRKRVKVMNEVSGKLSNRNLIPEDLTGLQLKAMLGDPQTTGHALTAFIEKARRLPMPGVYDLVEGYLKVSTDCTEIFKLLQGERLPDDELTLVWQTLENLLLRLAGDLYHMSAAGQSITRNLCFGHMKALYNSLSSKNINCVRACLRLLTAMVMQGTDCARDLLSHFDFNHRSLMVLPKQHDPKVKEDVRMVFVKFVLAFLLSGDASIISQTLAVKGLVADLLKTGLRQDRLSTVHLMLSTLRSRILKNVAINKTQKLSLFTPGVLAQLATLYSWNGIDDVTDIQDIEAQNDAGKVLVREQVHAFLLELCCSSKFGIGFHDPNFGTYGRVGNITLLRFLVAMHGIADDALKCELVIRVLRAFPDLLARFLSQCNLSFVPRQSSAWLHNMQLLRKIYEAQPVLSKALQSCHSIPIPRLVSMVLVTTVPPVLDRSTVSRGLMNSHVTVRQATLGLLLFVLRRLQNNMRWSQTEWLQLDLRSEAETLEFLTIFRDSLGKMLPDMTTIISTWHRASTQVEIASTTAQDEMTTCGDDKHVRDPQQVLIQSMILEVLLLYQHLIPHVVAQSSFDFTKLLQSIVGDDGKAHPLVQRRVLDLLLALPTGKFSWFRTRSSVCTQVPEEGEGKQSEHSMFLLVLQMFVTTEETQLRCSSQNLLLKVLDESGLFNFASHELHIWLQELLHVPLEGRNCVLILLERALCRLLTKPHVYTDLVAKWIRDAAVLQASLAVPELESGSVSISNIDEALDVVDVLMDSNEDLNDELEGPLDPMQLAASFPFSALVPATLDTWNHIAQSCSTTLGPMCEYLVSVLVCILHLQLEPLPLCLALQHQDEQFAGLVSEGCAGQRKADDSEACLSRLAGFHVYYSSWIPPQARLEPFPGIAAIPLIGKESEAGKSGELWDRLCAAYSRGEACFLEPDVQLSLKEAAAAAPRADLRPAIFHVLLYLRTCVDCFGQHKRAVGKALLSFYLELLQTFLEVSRISKEEAETTEPRNGLKVSEDDADNDMCTLMGIQSRDENNGEGAGIKNEAEAQSAMDLARAILEHPILDSWFLAAELGRFPAHSLRPSALHLVSKTLSLGAAELVRSAALLGAGGLLQVQWYTKRALVACEREVAGTADTPSLAHSSSALRCLSTLYDCTGAAQRAEVLHLLLGLPKHLLVFTLEELEPTTLTVYGKALLAMVTSARLEELQVLSCNELAQLVEMLSYSPDADAESLLDALTRLVCEVTLWADLLPHTLVSLCLSLNTPSAFRLTAELVRHSAAHCYAWEQWLLSHGAVRRLRQQLSVCWLIVSAHLDALEKHGVSLVGDHRVLNRLWKVLSPVLTRALSMTEDQTSGSEDQAVIDQEATQIALISRLLHIRPPPSWDRLLYKLPCLLQNPKQAFWWALVDGEMNREPVMNPTLRDDLAVAGLTAILASLGLGSASRGHITSIAPRLLRLLDDGAKISAALWNKFLKSALKFGLTDGPLLALLNSTMRRVYVAPPSGLLSFTKIHALLCSHSMFVSTLLTVERNEMNTCGNVDLQQRMDVKRELVKLLLFVIEKEPSVCQSEHFPVLLGAYRATLDSVDCQLLFLLQFYENHDVRLSNLRMLLWGEAVTEQRQKRETLGFTLWQEPSSRHVLSLLQHDRMLNTALRFPLKRRLMPPVSSEEFSVEVFGEESENIYDPCFLLPLFSTLAAPGSDLDCHYFTSMNGLAVVLAALASYDPAMRSAAYHVLAAFYVQLEGARFREKAELLYLVEFIRGGIYKANACLSFLVVIFFAKTASVLLRPEDPMYLHLNRFMFSHEFLDTKKVPAFYKFFFSSQAEYAGQTTEREWALSVLEVGLRDRTCVELCARQHIFILLLAYAGGPLADAASQELVFKVLINAARIPSGAYRLVQDHGVLCWLVGLLKRHLKEHKVLDRALELLKTLWKTNLGKKGTEGIKSESDGEQGGSEPKYAAQAVPERLEAGYAEDEDEDEDEEKKEKVDDAPAAQEAGRSRQTSRTGPTHPIKCLPMQMINEFVLVQHTFLKQDSMCRDVQSFCCLSRLLASMLSHRCVAMAAADKAGKVLANRSGLCHADMLYLLGTWARLACPGPARDALKRKDVCHDVHDDAGVRQPQSKSGKTRERHPRHGTSLQAKASPISSAAEATQESRLHLLRILCCWLPQEELRNAEDGRETVSETMKLCLEWLFADDTCFSLSSSDLLHLLRWLRNCAMSFAPLHTFAGTIATGLLRLIDEASAGNGNGRSWTAGTVSELQKEAQGLSESLLELLQRRTCDSKGNVMCVRSRCILDKVVMRFLVPAARDFDHPHLQAAASSLISLFQHEMWLSDDSPNLFLWLLGRMAEQDYTACNPELFNNIFSALAKIRKSNKLIAT